MGGKGNYWQRLSHICWLIIKELCTDMSQCQVFEIDFWLDVSPYPKAPTTPIIFLPCRHVLCYMVMGQNLGTQSTLQ